MSRAAFARLVGVTPLTVYRWELPIDASESRRPRGRAAELLTRYVGSAGRNVAASGSFEIAALLVPFRRLATRGLAPLQLQRELVEVTRATFGGRGVLLEEHQASGGVREVVAGPALARPERFQLGDGAARQLRLAVEGPLSPQERAGLAALAAYAALALEVALLREKGMSIG